MTTVTYLIIYTYWYVCYSSFFFWTESTYRNEVVSYDWVVDNTLLGQMYVFNAVGFPPRVWHVIVVPIGLTLLPGQSPPELHVILAQILRYQNCERIKENEICELCRLPTRMQLLIQMDRAPKERSSCENDDRKSG